MAKKIGDYYLGLDIGTDSIGWAVTDPQYNILEFNRKAMWGSYLFKEGQKAEDRRMHRIARRRLQRRKQRIALLDEFLAPEIAKVDPEFFQRLSESSLYAEDRKSRSVSFLLNDPQMTDAKIHREFPTIYHLRYALMTTNGKPDIRLVYLAMHHILKYRGHFLFEGISADGDLPKFEDIFDEMLERIADSTGIRFDVNENLEEIRSKLLDRKITITDKKKELARLMSPSDESDQKAARAVTDLLAGGQVSADKLFGDPDLKDIKINFKGTDFEDKADEIYERVGAENADMIGLMKQMYDWSYLSGLLTGHNYFSEMKMAEYEQHRQDLRELKEALLEIAAEDGSRDLYNKVFKSDDSKGYSHYSGMLKNVKKENSNTCSQEDFCKFLKDVLKDRVKGHGNMMARIEDRTFMPKPRSKENSRIPNSLHAKELNKILENVSRFYPFLGEPGEDGISAKDKIMMLCTFRLPYYIGPVGRGSKTGWAVRREEGSVTPWNFARKIDIEKSSQGFIERLIGFCSYLSGEKVIPKSSILYSRFMLYNELNNISVNDKRIDPGLKLGLVRDIFEKGEPKRVTVKAIQNYICSKTGVKGVQISGIDQTVKSSLSPEIRLSEALGCSIKGKQKEADGIIRLITIYGEDRKRLRDTLKANYKDLSKDQIARLSKLRFADWGRLSEKLLTGIYADVDGTRMNIITALEQTNRNLSELVKSDAYGFKKQIDAANAELIGEGGRITEQMMDDLYCSPAVKHAIRRALAVISDVEKAAGHPPKKVFIETTREHRESKRTESRKKELEALYKNCKDGDSAEWLSNLGKTDDARLRGKKLFAYYLQMGQCMYCDRNIDLNDLGNNDLCDLDHIYPRSKIQDDSLRNNMVLVCKECNLAKSNVYPISQTVQLKMASRWKYLHDKGLMNDEKYRRLTRISPFSQDELYKFINRQLTETSQSTNAVAKIMERIFGGETEVVYCKAGNVSEFRQEYKFLKCRNVNDYHHAKDAYLNIVVGNVHNVKFTKDPMRFLKEGGEYNFREIYKHDVSRSGETAWVAADENRKIPGTIATVSKYMRRNNILYTRYPYKVSGKFYDVLPLPKGKGQWKLKETLPIDKYGGYDSVSGAFFALVEHTVRKDRVRTIESVPVLYKGPVDKESLEEYFRGTGLEDPEVRVPCIRIDSMFEINGMRVSISGRTSNQIIYMCGEQLILPYDLHDYCKELYKYEEAIEKKSAVQRPEDYEIDPTMNIRLYDTLIEKLNGRYGSLQILKTQMKTLIALRSSFAEQSLGVQAKALNNVLHLFQCNSTRMDISDLEWPDEKKGPKEAGKLTCSNNISKFDSIFMINDSPTGIYESKIDLKTI